MQMRSRGRGAVGGGEEEVGLGHLCSCSLVSLKYHHPTCLLGKRLLVLQHSNTHEAFRNPPLCQTAVLPTLSPSSSLTNFDHCLKHTVHTYLFAYQHNNAHQCLLPIRHCSGLLTCVVSFNLHNSPFQSIPLLSPFHWETETQTGQVTSQVNMASPSNLVPESMLLTTVCTLSVFHRV